MSRRNRTPEENERRAKIRELLQTATSTVWTTSKKLFKEANAEFMENGLEAEPDDEPGYSRYDYKNKNTESSRNGHSSKHLGTRVSVKLKGMSPVLFRTHSNTI